MILTRGLIGHNHLRQDVSSPTHIRRNGQLHPREPGQPQNAHHRGRLRPHQAHLRRLDPPRRRTSQYPLSHYPSLTKLSSQRYDVVITADQEPLSYWFRAEAATECLYQNNFHALAVWTYSSVQPSTPYSIAWPEPGSCLDPSPLIPYWSSPVPYEPALGTLDVDLTRAVVTPGGANMVVWALNGSIDVDWEYPTMSYLLDGRITDQNLETFPYPEEMNLIPARPENRWNYWLIQQAPNVCNISHFLGLSPEGAFLD